MNEIREADAEQNPNDAAQEKRADTNVIATPDKDDGSLVKQACKKCGAAYNVANLKPGMKFRCKKCSEIVLVESRETFGEKEKTRLGTLENENHIVKFLKNKIQAEQENCENLIEEILELKQKINSLETITEQQRQLLDESREKERTLERVVAAQKNEIQQIEHQLDLKNREIASLNKMNEQVKNLNDEQRKTIDELKRREDNYLSDAKNYRDEIERLTSTIGQLEDNVNEKDTQINSLAGVVEKKNEQIERLKDREDDLVEQNKTLNAEIVELQKKLNQRESEIVELGATEERLTSTIGDLKLKITNYQKSIAVLKSKIQETGEILAQERQRIREKDEEIAEQKAQLAEFEVRIEEERERNRLDNLLAGLVSRRDELSAQIEKVTNYKSRVSKAIEERMPGQPISKKLAGLTRVAEAAEETGHADTDIPTIAEETLPVQDTNAVGTVPPAENRIRELADDGAMESEEPHSNEMPTLDLSFDAEKPADNSLAEGSRVRNNSRTGIIRDGMVEWEDGSVTPLNNIRHKLKVKAKA